MSNIWHIWHTKHKNGALSDVPNLKNYTTLLQYRLKYETVRTTMAKWDFIILLRFFLSSSTDISLSVDSSYFFSLCHSLCLPSPPCSRKLLKITLKKVVADLAASPSNPHRQSRQSSPLISPPHALVSVDLVGFGFVIGFWFGLRLWVVSQVTSMGWVEVVGCGFDGLI